MLNSFFLCILQSNAKLSVHFAVYGTCGVGVSVGESRHRPKRGEKFCWIHNSVFTGEKSANEANGGGGVGYGPRDRRGKDVSCDREWHANITRPYNKEKPLIIYFISGTLICLGTSELHCCTIYHFPYAIVIVIANERSLHCCWGGGTIFSSSSKFRRSCNLS